MKVLIGAILLLANAGLFAAPLTQVPAKFAVLRLEAVRTIEAGRTLLPEDPRDPFTVKYLPRLARIKAEAGAADASKTLEAAKAAYEAWKGEVFGELYPQVAALYGNDEAKAREYRERRANALLAAEHLSGVLSQAADRTQLDALTRKIMGSPDPRTLDKLFENVRVFSPAVIMPGPREFRAAGFSTPSEVSIRVPAAAAPVPSDYRPVVDYLVKQGASRRMVTMAVAEAKKQGADPLLVLSVIQAESFFNPKATSEAGAIGLMQIMPATGRGLGVSQSSSLYDPMTNLRAGVRFLKDLWNRFSDVAFSELGSINPSTRLDVQKAIAAYNAGPGAVRKYGGVPPYRETRNYVVKVLRYYAAMKRQLED